MAVTEPLISHFHTTKNSTKTHYLQTGDPSGILIVCLHGLGGSVNTFKSLVNFLPKTYNIVLVDFQGFGQTSLTSKTEPLTISGHVSDIHDLITYLQAPKNGLEREDKVRIR
jgi:pimeloyl-ACP methyl ester carboxylesterase